MFLQKSPEKPKTCRSICKGVEEAADCSMVDLHDLKDSMTSKKTVATTPRAV